MRKWKSHKVVEAERITEWNNAGPASTVTVRPPTGATTIVPVPESLFARGEPARGDYLVRYEDGYLSWSPKKAFEDGYAQVE